MAAIKSGKILNINRSIKIRHGFPHQNSFVHKLAAQAIVSQKCIEQKPKIKGLQLKCHHRMNGVHILNDEERPNRNFHNARNCFD